jgi:hypothetical protein
MKKFFIRVWNWLTSPFKKKSQPVIELTKEQVLFNKLKESGFFDEDLHETDEAKSEDLKLSAQKLNHYKTVRASVMELIPKDEGIQNAKETETLKDRMRLVSQGKHADERNRK